MADCTETIDICITRGDTYNLVVGLADGWDEVNANPSVYSGRLVFRDAHDDGIAEMLTITSPTSAGTDVRFENTEFVFDFTALPAQTQSLPSYDIVCFCEIVDLSGTYVRRLFNGRVKIED